MTDAQQIDLTGLDTSNGYPAVKHGAGINGAYGGDLLRQANEYVERGALTFLGKGKHQDEY